MRLGLAYGMAIVLTIRLAAPASAQIITTSIPRGLEAGSSEKSLAFHVMASPFAKWKYGEVYVDQSTVMGFISGKPNSDFMFAGEAALGKPSGINFSVGAWYNKVGTNTFDLVGFDPAANVVTATLETKLTLFEVHGGVFVKSFGLQLGMVKTSGDFFGGTRTSIRGIAVNLPFATPDQAAKTTDLDVFAVYKGRLADRLSLSVGAGAYRKQGVDNSPLRDANSQTVASGFVAASANVIKGFSVDASFWYIGKAKAEIATATLGFDLQSESQNRLTVGVGYTF